MRMLKINLERHILSKLADSLFFKSIKSIDLLECLKIDTQNNFKLIIVKIVVKDGTDLKQLKLPKSAVILDILSSDNGTYTCLMKVHFNKVFIPILKKFFKDNVIWKSPTYMNENTITLTCIGDEKSLNEIIRDIEEVNTFKEAKLSYFHSCIEQKGIQQILTSRQLEVMRCAKDWGYYDSPRKITSEELAKKIGCSKSTLLEHLKNAENKIVNYII